MAQRTWSREAVATCVKANFGTEFPSRSELILLKFRASGRESASAQTAED